MSDFIINLKVNSTESVTQLRQASGAINDLGKKLEKVQQASKWRQELAGMARQERRDAFEKLSNEQKMVKLTERRIQLEKRLAQAQEAGNAYRAMAMRRQLANVNSDLRGVGPRKGFMSEMFGSMGGGFIGAAFGGGLGAMIGSSIGGFLSSIPTKMMEAARSMIELADSIGDRAEQFQMKREDIFRMRQASSQAGVRQAVGERMLTGIQAARAEAATNPELMGLFGRYGVSPKDVLDQKVGPLQIGNTIRRTLGTGGVLGGDIGKLKKLGLGKPQAAAALLEKMMEGEGVSGTGLENDLKGVDKVALELEQIEAWKERAGMKAMGQGAGFLQKTKNRWNRQEIFNKLESNQASQIHFGNLNDDDQIKRLGGMLDPKKEAPSLFGKRTVRDTMDVRPMERHQLNSSLEAHGMYIGYGVGKGPKETVNPSKYLMEIQRTSSEIARKMDLIMVAIRGVL